MIEEKRLADAIKLLKWYLEPPHLAEAGLVTPEAADYVLGLQIMHDCFVWASGDTAAETFPLMEGNLYGLRQTLVSAGIEPLPCETEFEESRASWRNGL